MKIAVTASNPELSSPVDPRFGRCAYFLFIDPETMEFEAVENPNVSSASGAGIQSAQLVAEKGANVLLTGSCGPNAFRTLQAAGVEVLVGLTGNIQEAVQMYKSGKLQQAAEPNVPSHSGMAGYGNPPMGPGFGGGGGMGRGMGRGMCRGMGFGMGPGFPPDVPGTMPPGPNMPQATPEEELQYLKKQADLLRQHMEKITKRIEEIEKKK